MIEDLRFIVREVAVVIPPTSNSDGFLRGETLEVRRLKILQAYDGHVWFDVPLIEGIYG